MPFVLTSDAFVDGGDIPVQYTCRGENISPALMWTGAPEATASFAMLMTDPDAGDFVHWVIYNIPGTSTGLAEARPTVEALDDGTLQGTNDFAPFADRGFPPIGYGGPCPPAPHRYVFALFALDTTLDLAPGATLQAVSEALAGHVVAQTELAGNFDPGS